MSRRAIDRTTDLFVASVKEALPGARITIDKSRAAHGRSNYVYIDAGQAWRRLKVRISDHPVGMRRARYGDEDLFIHHLAKPSSWAVYVSELPRRLNRCEQAADVRRFNSLARDFDGRLC